MEKGYYLYCIRKIAESRCFRIKGIDNKLVSILPYRDLEAVVSKISIKKFGSKEIQKKAQEDLGWVRMEALIHEKVIEETTGTVVPMKFGTIFKTKEKLEEILKKYYPKFKRDLEKLEGKQEWAVKVYLNRKIFEEEIKKSCSVFQEKEKEITLLPEGTAYFMQKQLNEAVSKETDKILQNYNENFFEFLKRDAEIGSSGKILEKELTGKTLPMVMNGIYLISEKRVGVFLKKVNKLNQEHNSKGFHFEYSGPWPPYNFV